MLEAPLKRILQGIKGKSARVFLWKGLGGISLEDGCFATGAIANEHNFDFLPHDDFRSLYRTNALSFLALFLVVATDFREKKTHQLKATRQHVQVMADFKQVLTDMGFVPAAFLFVQ